MSEISQLLGADPNLKVAVIEHAAMGDNTIVAGVAGRRVKLVHLNFLSRAAVNARLKSGAGTNLSGVYQFLGPNGLAFDGRYHPLMTNAGDAFVINLSAAVEIDGFVLYFQEA